MRKKRETEFPFFNALNFPYKEKFKAKSKSLLLLNRLLLFTLCANVVFLRSDKRHQTSRHLF